MIDVSDLVRRIGEFGRFSCFSCGRNLHERHISTVSIIDRRVFYNCGECDNNGYRSFGALGIIDEVEFNYHSDNDLEFPIIGAYGRDLRIIVEEGEDINDVIESIESESEQDRKVVNDPDSEF